MAKPHTLHLSAYQKVELVQQDLGDQFTKSGTEPHTMVARITTANDDAFKNRTVTLLLKEADQRMLIEALTDNLNGKGLNG